MKVLGMWAGVNIWLKSPNTHLYVYVAKISKLYSTLFNVEIFFYVTLRNKYVGDLYISADFTTLFRGLKNTSK